MRVCRCWQALMINLQTPTPKFQPKAHRLGRCYANPCHLVVAPKPRPPQWQLQGLPNLQHPPVRLLASSCGKNHSRRALLTPSDTPLPFPFSIYNVHGFMHFSPLRLTSPRPMQTPQPLSWAIHTALTRSLRYRTRKVAEMHRWEGNRARGHLEQFRT